MSKKKGSVSKKIEQKIKEYFSKLKDNDVKSDTKINK
jgi:hypothetical protein